MQKIISILLTTILTIITGISGFALTLIPMAILALLSIWLCDIDADNNYTWYSGIWHALWFLPNLLKSIFTDGLYKAEIYTIGYSVFWWITNIIGLTYMFFKMGADILAIIIIVILFHFL